MKKVCHLTSAHNRYDIRIFEKECRTLADNGFDTFLVVNDDNPSEHKEGITIISTGYRPNNRVDRIINSKRKMFEVAIKTEADIYHLHDPELLQIALKLKKNGGKVIFDSHEDVPSQILGKHWIPKIFRNAVSKIYSKYERYVLTKLDAVISVTPHLTERLIKLNKNVVEVTNYPRIESKEPVSNNRQRAVCFAGSISPQWMHEHIVNAVEKIGNIKYFLCGLGSNDYLTKLKALNGWNQVEYLGKIPHSEVQEIYNQAMVGMAVASYNKNVKGNLGTLGNTKLFEIMMAGLPVICTDFILWEKIIDDCQCGICVKPDNVEEIASSIRYLLDNPDVAKQMGENGRRAVVEKYNWGVEEKKLIKLYQDLLEKQEEKKQ